MTWIPNVYIFGPGNSVRWREEAFDQVALQVMAMFTGHNIPFYSLAKLGTA